MEMYRNGSGTLCTHLTTTRAGRGEHQEDGGVHGGWVPPLADLPSPTPSSSESNDVVFESLSQPSSLFTRTVDDNSHTHIHNA